MENKLKKVKITLVGESSCSTIKECTEEQIKFLIYIANTMGDDINESNSPMMYIKFL